MLDRELAILREAALISMEEKEKEQEEKELAALREAALHSARERKDSSDPLRKRRLKSPPSYHNSDKMSEPELEEPLTPKMFGNDSEQHTPTRIEPAISTVFHVKVNDTMMLKRSSSNQSVLSAISEKSAPLHHKRTEDSIRVKVTAPCTPPVSVTSEDEEDVRQKHEKRSNKAIVTDVSPVISKVSSMEDISPRRPAKKLKKKHKKHKKSSTSSTTKSKKREKHRPELILGEERSVKKSNSSNHRISKKGPDTELTNNGKDSSQAKEELDRYNKMEKNLKKEIINDIDVKIDKNIELLQRQKKHKHEHRASRVDPKKIISEDISSNEEEELLKHDKKRSVSPKQKDRSKKSRPLHSKPKSRSPSPGPDVSVSLMSKREFERMKAEMNKNPTTKPSPKKEHKSSRAEEKRAKKREDKSTTSPKKSKENGHSSSEKVYECTKSNKPPKSPETKETNPDEIGISIKEEEELLKDAPIKPPPVPVQHDPDIVSVMKEDSFSDSDQEPNVGNVGQDKKIGDKKKKSKKTKKKKRDDKKKKKKRKKRNSDSLSTSDEDARERKKQKVKIDKSELNKIVQFLKQRDEAQKAVDGVSGSKTAFNPKLINKDSKPIEIKLKSKPKR